MRNLPTMFDQGQVFDCKHIRKRLILTQRLNLRGDRAYFILASLGQTRGQSDTFHINVCTHLFMRSMVFGILIAPNPFDPLGYSLSINGYPHY